MGIVLSEGNSDDPPSVGSAIRGGSDESKGFPRGSHRGILLG